MLEALRIILDESNYPLHVMDHQGSHRTGTVLGCLRKAQRWSLTSIFDEYRRYAGPKVRLANEQFIELFDTDLVNGKSSRLRAVRAMIATRLTRSLPRPSLTCVRTRSPRSVPLFSALQCPAVGHCGSAKSTALPAPRTYSNHNSGRQPNTTARLV